MESAHANNNVVVAHACSAAVSDMTNGSSISAAVRRAGEKTNCKANAEASAETSATAKNSF
jgi:hypothetical protein